MSWIRGERLAGETDKSKLCFGLLGDCKVEGVGAGQEVLQDVKVDHLWRGLS